MYYKFLQEVTNQRKIQDTHPECLLADFVIGKFTEILYINIGLLKYYTHTQAHTQVQTPSVYLSQEKSVNSRKEALFLLTAWQQSVLSVCSIRDWKLGSFARRSLLTTLLPVFLSAGSHFTCSAPVRFCNRAVTAAFLEFNSTDCYTDYQYCRTV